jgi:hypothetical protein
MQLPRQSPFGRDQPTKSAWPSTRRQDPGRRRGIQPGYEATRANALGGEMCEISHRPGALLAYWCATVPERTLSISAAFQS